MHGKLGPCRAQILGRTLVTFLNSLCITPQVLKCIVILIFKDMKFGDTIIYKL